MSIADGQGGPLRNYYTPISFERHMRLPLFPLSIVLYPSERIPLHIYEARYRTMTEWCLNENEAFGVLCQDDGELAEVGCTARISRVLQRYKGGRSDILIAGEQRFKVLALYDNRAYPTGDILYLQDTHTVPVRVSLERVIAQHMRLLEIAGRKICPSVYREASQVSFLIARSAGLTLQQKQAVLEISSEQARIEYLIAHFEEFIPRIEKTQALRQKIQSNGHLEHGGL